MKVQGEGVNINSSTEYSGLGMNTRWTDFDRLRQSLQSNKNKARPPPNNDQTSCIPFLT